MALSGRISNRRAANARSLALFGVEPSAAASELYRVIRKGSGPTVFTVGYERRSGEDLMAALRDAGIDYLADIRDKPVSRKPDFRAAALRGFCAEAGIEYGGWSTLGSTEAQRDQLHESGDLAKFHKTFRAYACRHLREPLDQLASIVQDKSVALLCYERVHEECHRSVVADLVADRLNAGITAIV